MNVWSISLKNLETQTISLLHYPQIIKTFIIDTKWSIDKKKGDGFKIGDEIKIELFDEMKVSGYGEKVLNYLVKTSGATNMELLDFGLENNFLPKHTKAVLDELKRTHKIEINSLDGKPALSYYLGDEKRLVKIKIIN